MYVLDGMTPVRPVKNAALGMKLREARQRAGLSHDRLGAAVGTSRQHLINLEKGWHRPGDGLLARIAEATGLPIEFFVSADEQEVAEQATPFVVEMAEMFARAMARVEQRATERTMRLLREEGLLI